MRSGVRMSGLRSGTYLSQIWRSPLREKIWRSGAWTAVFLEGSLDENTRGRVFAIAAPASALGLTFSEQTWDRQLLWSPWQWRFRSAKDTSPLSRCGVGLALPTGVKGYLWLCRPTWEAFQRNENISSEFSQAGQAKHCSNGSWSHSRSVLVMWSKHRSQGPSWF